VTREVSTRGKSIRMEWDAFFPHVAPHHCTIHEDGSLSWRLRD